MTRNQAFGADRERKVKKQLEQDGWCCTKAGGSLGAADLVCLKADHPSRMVQIKGNHRGPFSKFPPGERAALRAISSAAGAEPWLVWWPPRKGCEWIPESAWPQP